MANYLWYTKAYRILLSLINGEKHIFYSRKLIYCLNFQIFCFTFP